MKIFLKIFIVLFLIFGGVLLYSLYVGTTGLITKEYVLYSEKLPIDFDGVKVVHFSDLHFGRTVDLEKVDSIVTEINLVNPDIVVFTGDLIDKDISISKNESLDLVNLLKKINSKYGKFSVIGNHDYLIKDDTIKLLEDSGFKFLENEYETVISKNNQIIYVMGLGNVSYNLDNVSEMTKDVKDKEGFKIVLTHEPDISDKIIDEIDVDLILAGHSHNGQFRLPFIGAIYTPNGAKKYYDEYYDINGTSLYISSGIGTSRYNLRFFNRPSINFYRINKKELTLE